jgi:uncharacterized membrane protein YhaH (DUF805 family)
MDGVSAMDVVAAKKLLFSHRGRLRRRTFWAVAIFAALPLAVVGLVGSVLAPLLDVHDGRGAVDPVMSALGLVGFAVVLLMGVIDVTIGIRRLHDRDKSGWWLAVFYGVPAVLRLSVPFLQPIPALVAYVCYLVFWVWAIIELGILRGTVGPNRYGEDPIADDPPWTIDPLTPGSEAPSTVPR